MEAFRKALAGLGLATAGAGCIVVVIGLILLLPLVLIFGLNLLGFSIPYTVETWFGAFFVAWCLRGGSSSSCSCD